MITVTLFWPGINAIIRGNTLAGSPFTSSVNTLGKDSMNKDINAPWFMSVRLMADSTKDNKGKRFGAVRESHIYG